MNNVTDSKRQPTLCSGCGVCAAVCPKNCLFITENEYGELRPAIQNNACVQCERCLTVCPFEKTADRVTAEEHCYIGAADAFEREGSSGGVALWMMTKLLELQMVDAVICVRAQNEANQLFNYTACHTAEELKACSGSAYYPVTMSEILQQIRQCGERVAIIGVPCFVNAIQNIRKADSILAQKIVFVMGLVCGHMPNKKMVDCLAWSKGKQRAQIQSCHFRIKEETRPAWDYGVRLQFDDETDLRSYGSDNFGYLFWRRLFSQECCNHCNDVFAENADITFMDAWLPEYKEKTVGTSMVICRNPVLETVLQQLPQEGWLEAVAIEKAYEAQQSLCEYKRNAGHHQKESKLQRHVKQLCLSRAENPQIIDEIKRTVYKSQLKKQNPLLWALLEIKDKVIRK